MAADVQSTVPVDVLVAVIAVVQLLVQGMVQVVLYFITSKDKAEIPNNRAILEEILAALERGQDVKAAESHMVRDLYDMHKVTDKEGRPIWYFPGSVADLVKQVSDSQTKIASILETIVRQLESRRPR